MVAIINRRNAMLMANATAQLVQPGTFNWIASDAWGIHMYPTKNDEMFLDTFSFRYRVSRVPEFEDWFLQLTLVSRPSVVNSGGYTKYAYILMLYLTKCWYYVSADW